MQTNGSYLQIIYISMKSKALLFLIPVLSYQTSNAIFFFITKELIFKLKHHAKTLKRQFKDAF